MKKLLVVGLVGLMAMFTLVGCGTKDKSPVETGIEVVSMNEMFKNDPTEITWMRYSFWSDNSSEAYRHCKESYYEHLDRGETVSEIIETEDTTGSRYYYFKVKVAG